jgi:hypothetical protein
MLGLVQGADALIAFAEEKVLKGTQLLNYASVTKANAEHRLVQAQRILSELLPSEGLPRPHRLQPMPPRADNATGALNDLFSTATLQPHTPA